MSVTIDSLAQPLLVNKTGKLKHRYRLHEKLEVLDPTSPVDVTEARLKAFQSLFAFR